MKIDIFPCREYFRTKQVFVDETEFDLLKPQMLDRLAFIDQLFERINTNAQVHIEIFLRDPFIAP